MIATVVAPRTMPSLAAGDSDTSPRGHTIQTYTLPARTLSDKSLFARDYSDSVHHAEPPTANGKPASGPAMQAMPTARAVQPPSGERRSLQTDGTVDKQRGSSAVKQDVLTAAEPHTDLVGAPARDDGYFASVQGSQVHQGHTTTHVTLNTSSPPDSARDAHKDTAAQPKTSSESQPSNPPTSLLVPGASHRVSSPPAFNHAGPSPVEPPYRLQHRHTLEVPSVSSARAQSLRHPAEDVVTASGRFSPVSTPTRRRGSLSLARRTTRSIHSDMHLEEVPQDEDAARWAEHIRQKRASKRKRRDDEDDDRVVVGTKVDQNHVNWVTAYNMLTGIRFTVSRTNAKMDRDLTDADFDAKHKFSFDIAGNELTPSAKYDFKFKDYAPWVFRHLRSIFGLDPADYLVSLTSKYILSELGSPGKSGSFFYFSRDYKYIIKTIHHGEHKFLRKILKDYYNHVQENPNTLLSQFYGLHRVKIPYGRKIHFVVMNNLFPPHRDIHRTFDLKGSTIGRDFKEEGLEANPRATLKDLNWLRRNQHLEFGPAKKKAFVEQMQKDVKLLQKLHIMDYSMLIGVHDLEKGNEENLRDKTLRVFQPGGEDSEDAQPTPLARTPSKLESARKAKELRQMIKTQKPVPMDQIADKMPDELQGQQKNNYFYVDDGGFRATHEDDTPGEEIYYLGIIDCLTHYNLIKRIEHRWKGLANEESQISAIPPERYGDRFIKFMSSVTKTREATDGEKVEQSAHEANDPVLVGVNDSRSGRESTDNVLHQAETQAERSRRRGASEEDVPKREMRAVRSPSAERGELGTTLPVVEEAHETSSTGGRSAQSTDTHLPSAASPALRQEDRGLQNGSSERDRSRGRPPPTPPKDSGIGANERRPPTPPKDPDYNQRQSGPPTPPKEEKKRGRNKDLPHVPPMETVVRVG